MDQINELTKKAMEKGEELSKNIMEHGKNFTSGSSKTKDDALKNGGKMNDAAKDTASKATTEWICYAL